jgi:hypothetical protein
MSEYSCFLITVLYQENGTLLRCALKVEANSVPVNCYEHPTKPESREYFHSLLPEHVRSCGPVVAVEPLFEVVDRT